MFDLFPSRLLTMSNQSRPTGSMTETSDFHLEPSVRTGGAIGPYRIVSRLGGGGMGVIYRAVHVENGRAAAVKTVRTHHRAHLSSIRTEIHALSRLENPGVVRILDQGTADGLPWYAMELLEGTTLRDWIDRTWPDARRPIAGPMPTADTAVETPRANGGALVPSRAPHAGAPQATAANGHLDEVLRLFARICSSLAFIHGEGIVHRDLKPANVFVRDDGSPVLVDFGLASSSRDAIGRARLEIAGELMGTAPYMAPEQVRAEPVDARTDLYALGCMLYEALTGQVPFSSSTARRDRQEAPLPVAALAVGAGPGRACAARAPGHAAAREESVGSHRPRRRRRRDALRRRGTHRGHRPRRMPSPVRAARTTAGYLYRPELVGRDEALAALEDAIAHAADGAGSLMVIAGESGAGKTFLAAEAGRRAQLRELRVVAGDALAIALTDGRGEAATGGAPIHGPPFHLFRPLLQTVADLCREAPDDAVFAELLGERAAILAPYEPSLAVLRGQDRRSHLAEIPGEATRRRAIDALMDVLAACARGKPLCLILDDLQWADDLSMALLTSLPVGWLADQKILLIATCRSEEMTDDVRALVARPDVRSLRLPMLSEGAVTSLVGGNAGHEARAARRWSAFSRARPRATRSSSPNICAPPSANTCCTASAVTGGSRPPRAATRARSNRWRCPARCRSWCNGGCGGFRPERAIWCRWRRCSGASSTARCSRRSRISTSHPFSRRAPSCGAREILEDAGAGRLRFVHDKMREVTYQGMTADQRRRNHLRAGQALEARYRGTADIELLSAELAHHFTIGGDTRRAIDYLEKAGQQALASSANRESIQRFRDALVLASRRHGHQRRPARDLGATDR